MENNKISVKEYIEDNTKLEISYTPFDEKMSVVSHVLRGVLESVGGLNTSLLRRVSTEVFIETITNIDMNIADDNELKGFDQLCYLQELDKLETYMGYEYQEFQRILSERVDDYIRIETNPAITIEKIYDELMDVATKGLDFIHDTVQNLDPEQISTAISKFVPMNGGDNIESK